MFGRLRERKCAGLGKMYTVPTGERGSDGFGGQLAGKARKREELTASGEEFRGAAFVGIDVGNFMAEHTLMAGAEGGEREGVGCGAIEDKESFTISGEEIAEKLARSGRGSVFAVAGRAGFVGGV